MLPSSTQRIADTKRLILAEAVHPQDLSICSEVLMRLSRKQWTLPGAGILGTGTPARGFWPERPTKPTPPSSPRPSAASSRSRLRLRELRAIKFVQISVPQNAQQANQYQMKISSIVPEGTVVKAGDIVAELDRSGIATQASNVSLALQKAQAVYEQCSNLSKAREDMRTMELTLEEKKLAKEQSVYEAPTVRRQAEIDLEKAQRAGPGQTRLQDSHRAGRGQDARGGGRPREELLAIVTEVMANFTIRARAGHGDVREGMEWEEKGLRLPGAWEPAVATLPDLTQMESITYVNEIDVRKIAVGQAELCSTPIPRSDSRAR